MWKTKLQATASLFIAVNTISWFTLTLILIINRLAQAPSFETMAISTAYFGGLILTAIIGGTLLREKLLEKKYLMLWTIAGTLSSFLFFLFYPQANLLTEITLSLILSSTIGLGIPLSLSIFSHQTKYENRGRIGAITFFSIQLITASIFFVISETATADQFLVLSIWRLAGMFGLLNYKSPEKAMVEKKIQLSSILKERRFLLLFLPWFFFVLINYIQTPIVELFMEDKYNEFVLITSVISSFAAIGGGILCDLKGRKTAGIIGFVFLGIGYGVLSIFSDWLGKYAFMIFDGVAWGFLYVTFIFVVWADLSERGNYQRERYYILGGLPFLISGLIPVLIQPFAQHILESKVSFTLASFFLFIAILPLVYASETLPEKIVKERELNNYIQKALDQCKKEE